MQNREGAFARYQGQAVDVVGYTTCEGCPGGNIEYAVDEMKSYGASVIHLATGMIVGYPPCPPTTCFHDFIKARFGIEAVYGTHPIPQKYLNMHDPLGTWNTPAWQAVVKDTLNSEKIRLTYD